MKKILLSIILLLTYCSTFAQEVATTEMADKLRASGKIYVVIAVIVVIFVGLALYLFSIDRRLKKIEKEK